MSKFPDTVELNQCRYSYPSAPLVIRNAEDYLQEHPANHIPLDHEVPYLRGALQETLVELNRLDKSPTKAASLPFR
ncbi:hypothetical protein WG66_008131 [Moniliophthora roreri]|nr:hypothetical protein WG66_008131 [Moniliophthora roreri]